MLSFFVDLNLKEFCDIASFFFQVNSFVIRFLGPQKIIVKFFVVFNWEFSNVQKKIEKSSLQ